MSKRSDEQLSKVKAIALEIVDDHGEVPLDALHAWLGRKMGELLSCAEAAVADLRNDNSELRAVTRKKLDALTDRLTVLETDRYRHIARLDKLELKESG